MKAGLLILGILIVGGFYFYSNIMITPQQRSQIQLANSVCNFNVWGGFTAGDIGGLLSPEIANQCQQISGYATLLAFTPYGYAVGLIFIFLGLVMGGGATREVVREIHHYKEEPEEDEEDDDEEPEETSKGSYCDNCGSKISKNAKFCGRCGKKA